MKYNYQFSSLIGSSYQNGHICFTNDGNSILSPVGNNVSLLRLKKDEIKTFQVNSSYNIEHIALSPKENIMLCINEEGFANVVSMVTGNVVNNHYFRQKINCVSFSPDGKMFAVGRGKLVMVFWSPTLEQPLTQFRLYRTFDGPNDDITSISWTDDSKAFLVGSQDSNSRVYAAFKTKKLVVYSLGGVLEGIIKTSFMKDSLDVLSVGRNAQVCYFKCNKELSFLSEEDPAENSEEPLSKKSKPTVSYLKAKSYFYRNITTGHPLQVEVTAADFHRATNLLVTGFIDGRVMIHEMPEFSPRFILSVCQDAISSMSFNCHGSWIGIASSATNELSVLCWSSQSLIYQSTGHKRSSITSLDYSPDGNNLVTGGHDGVVKLWQLLTGRCIVTFSQHSGPVTGVVFPKRKTQLIFSSSLDGTVKGYELSRLKNFCVLTAEEKSYQFSCVSCDDEGDLVAAGGGSDCFSVFVWAIKTRKLIYVLTGHEQPVCSVMFSSASGGNCLVSGSWDSTMRIWQLLGGESKEVINNTADVLAVAFRPDGLEIAASLLTGVLIFFDPLTAEQTHEISGKYDLGLSKHEGELVTAKKASEEKMFQTLCYSSCGHFLLAGGNSKFICLYNVSQELLVRRFEISCNLSLEGVLEVHDRKRITEWGFSDVHIDTSTTPRALPGVNRDNNTKRQIKIDAIVSSVKFSPTGTNFAAAGSEGVMIFSTERSFRSNNYIGGAIDFSQLQHNISPESIIKALEKKRFATALNDALKLKRIDVLTKVTESIPVNEVMFIVKQLNINEVGLQLCRFMVHQLQNSINVGFYVHWMNTILFEWTETIWRSSDLEWKTVLIDINRSIKFNQKKMASGLLAVHKAAFIDIMVHKNAQENIQ